MIRATKSARRCKGSALAFILAIVLTVILALAFFALKFGRVLGGSHEQKTSIEAAALAVANDLNKIVIEDPNFGFVALSDYAPIGKNTAAGDLYSMPVQSINTVLATVRLDMIIADAINDPIMKQFAKRDYQNALVAQASLVNALQAAMQPKGTGVDMDGNTISPTDDALAAYQSNQVHITNGQSNFIQSSLKLSLGTISSSNTNLSTTTAVAQPWGSCHISTDQQGSGMYLANVDVAYDGNDFIFAAVSSGTALVDQSLFQMNLPGLAYLTPTIVKCEADERTADNNNLGGNASMVVHAAACAEPGSQSDPRPNPGALVISFAYGGVPDLTKPGDLLTSSQLQTSPTDLLQQPTTGDYPSATLSNMSLPTLAQVPTYAVYPNGIDPLHPAIDAVMHVAFYDWIRRAGPSLNVQAAIDMLNTPFITPGNTLMHIYEVTPQGSITYYMAQATPSPGYPASDDQILALSGMAYHSSNGNFYDVFVKDYAYQPGRPNGGIHGGEPLLVPGLPSTGGNSIAWDLLPAALAVSPSGSKGLSENPASWLSFPTGPGGGVIRPTYQTMGASEFVMFRTVPTEPPLPGS